MRDINGSHLHAPFCAEVDYCWLGQVGRAVGSLTQSNNSAGLFITLHLLTLFLSCFLHEFRCACNVDSTAKSDSGDNWSYLIVTVVLGAAVLFVAGCFLGRCCKGDHFAGFLKKVRLKSIY